MVYSETSGGSGHITKYIKNFKSTKNKPNDQSTYMTIESVNNNTTFTADK